MLKRVTSIVLGILLVELLAVHIVKAASALSDAQNTIYSTSMNALFADGVIQGYPDGTGRPGAAINRAEVVAAIVRSQPQLKAQAETYKGAMPGLPLFTDVNQAVWYAPALEVAFAHGIVQGYPDGTFRGQQTVRTEEAIAMIIRAFGGTNAAVPFASSAEISNIPGEWYSSAVSDAVTKNLFIKGSRMFVGMPATRGQVFEMLYRMREIQKTNASAFVEPVSSTSIRVQQPVAQVPVAAVQQQQPVTMYPVQSTVVAANQPAVQPARQVEYPPMSQADIRDALQYASSKPFALTIPSLDIHDLIVTHPSDTKTQDGVLAVLQKGVGHLFSYPGGGGKVMIYGHSSGYPWDLSPYTKVFRTVNKLVVGDLVYMTYNDKLYIYKVTQKKTIAAKDKSVFTPDANGEQLILYTCWPPDSISQRYLVIANPIQVISVDGRG